MIKARTDLEPFTSCWLQLALFAQTHAENTQANQDCERDFNTIFRLERNENCHVNGEDKLEVKEIITIGF